jgi:hypothetical protein
MTRLWTSPAPSRTKNKTAPNKESERLQGMSWMCHRQMYARRAAVRDKDVEGPFADVIEQDGVFQSGPLTLVYMQQTGSIPDEKRPFADGM